MPTQIALSWYIDSMIYKITYCELNHYSLVTVYLFCTCKNTTSKISKLRVVQIHSVDSFRNQEFLRKAAWGETAQLRVWKDVLADTYTTFPHFCRFM